MNKPTKITEFRLKLYPKDFYKVREFYEKNLGFKVTKEWDRTDMDKGVMFDVGGTTLELLSPKKGYRAVAGVDVSWAVPDVWQLWEHMKNSENVVFTLRENSWGDSSFCITDPEDFKITFFTKHKSKTKASEHER